MGSVFVINDDENDKGFAYFEIFEIIKALFDRSLNKYLW
jgi:hypothetical protein